MFDMLFEVLQVLSVILVAVVVTTALAHALELPGKMRLDREAYLTVQRIYYPGFTIAGFGEVLAPLAVAVLLFLTPSESADFWLTLVALLGLVGVQAVYWMVTHPANKFWLQGEALGRAGSAFFSSDPTGRSGVQTETRPTAEWTDLRDRWEYSHVARAGLALVSLITLVIAVS